MSTDNATKTDLLSLQDRLNKLDAMADDPWKYKAVEWDEAYADAQYEARACKGMALGVQAADIAKRFRRAGKRFHACAELDLVPAEKAISLSMACCSTKPVSIGPGDPDPPPPPPTKTLEPWTGKSLYEATSTKKGHEVNWTSIPGFVQKEWDDIAAVANERMGLKGP